MPPDDPLLAGRLRGLVKLVAVIAAVLSIVAFLPGERVYRDANNCRGQRIGHAIGEVADALGSHSGGAAAGPAVDGCVASYTVFVEQHDAGGMLVVLFFVALLAPGLAVYTRPSRVRAWLWLAWVPIVAVVSFVIVVIVAVGGDLLADTRSVGSTATNVLGYSAPTLLGVIFVALLVILIGTPKPPKPPELPAARVV